MFLINTFGKSYVLKACQKSKNNSRKLLINHKSFNIILHTCNQPNRNKTAQNQKLVRWAYGAQRLRGKHLSGTLLTKNKTVLTECPSIWCRQKIQQSCRRMWGPAGYNRSNIYSTNESSIRVMFSNSFRLAFYVTKPFFHFTLTYHTHSSTDSTAQLNCN